MAQLPECPASLKPVQHYLKVASEHEGRDACVVYWARVHALQYALKLGAKGAQETQLLMALMDWLEAEKKAKRDDETVSDEVVAQAHLENYALKLFLYADKQDREGNYGKNVVKAFYTSGIVYDILATFGELTDEVLQNRKYAKWKAAYIHNCLKNGEVPVPGPSAEGEGNNLEEGTAGGADDGPTPQPRSEPPPPSSSAAADSSSLKPDPINVLPSVPQTPHDPNPGGFRPYVPAATPSSPAEEPTRPVGPAAAAHLTAEQTTKAQKYCKWAASALNYDDVPTAILNLTNALQLLRTGHDPA